MYVTTERRCTSTAAREDGRVALTPVLSYCVVDVTDRSNCGSLSTPIDLARAGLVAHMY